MDVIFPITIFFILSFSHTHTLSTVTGNSPRASTGPSKIARSYDTTQTKWYKRKRTSFRFLSRFVWLSEISRYCHYSPTYLNFFFTFSVFSLFVNISFWHIVMETTEAKKKTRKKQEMISSGCEIDFGHWNGTVFFLSHSPESLTLRLSLSLSVSLCILFNGIFAVQQASTVSCQKPQGLYGEFTFTVGVCVLSHCVYCVVCSVYAMCRL